MIICDSCNYRFTCNQINIVRELETNINKGIVDTTLVCDIRCTVYDRFLYLIDKPIGIHNTHNILKRKHLFKLCSKSSIIEGTQFKLVDLVRYHGCYKILGYTFPILKDPKIYLQDIYFYYISIYQDSFLYKLGRMLESYCFSAENDIVRCVQIQFDQAICDEINMTMNKDDTQILMWLLSKNEYKNWNTLCELVYSQYKIPITIMPNYYTLIENTE